MHFWATVPLEVGLPSQRCVSFVAQTRFVCKMRAKCRRRLGLEAPGGFAQVEIAPPSGTVWGPGERRAQETWGPSRFDGWACAPLAGPPSRNPKGLGWDLSTVLPSPLGDSSLTLCSPPLNLQAFLYLPAGLLTHSSLGPVSPCHTLQPLIAGASPSHPTFLLVEVTPPFPQGHLGPALPAIL